MRLYGDDGYKEYTIPPDETKGLIEIIDFYETSLFERQIYEASNCNNCIPDKHHIVWSNNF